jgi:predicted ferric reductase
VILATLSSSHLFWITSRAAGTAALLVSSVAVAVGLATGARWLHGDAGRDLRPVHETLSLATLALISVHGLSLLGDRFIGFTPSEIAIPFASDYQRFWTGIGVLAFWALVALGGGYYVRASIGVQRWRFLHRFTALAWLAGVAHALAQGSDARSAWFLGLAAIAVVPVTGLLAMRWSSRRSARPRAHSAPAPSLPR